VLGLPTIYLHPERVVAPGPAKDLIFNCHSLRMYSSRGGTSTPG
jgi:hypothetical protein